MKKIRFIYAIIPLIFLTGCSNKTETKQEEKVSEQKLAQVDTNNILVALVCKDGKYGYINSDLKMVINPQFDAAMPFGEGLGCVKVGDKWGFVNIKGEFVINPTYDNPGVFHEGLAKVGNMVGNGNGSIRYFYINNKGENVFKTEYRFGEDFNNGIAKVKDGYNKEIFLNIKGETVVTGPPYIYNHFKYPKKPYGGQVSKSLKLDPKTGNPVAVKYDAANFGYTDEFGNAATEAIYCAAGEFNYSYKTPAKYFSTNKNDTIAAALPSNSNNPTYKALEVQATYKKAESVESENGERILITFVLENKEEIVFDDFNPKNNLISLFFICKECSGDKTVKPMVGKKYKLKYSLQKIEAEGGGVQDYKVLEAVEH